MMNYFLHCVIIILIHFYGNYTHGCNSYGLVNSSTQNSMKVMFSDGKAKTCLILIAGRLSFSKEISRCNANFILHSKTKTTSFWKRCNFGVRGKISIANDLLYGEKKPKFDTPKWEFLNIRDVCKNRESLGR